MAIRKSKTTTYDSLAIFIPRKFFIGLLLWFNIRCLCTGQKATGFLFMSRMKTS